MLQRDHPLDAQRILYLYEMLNIAVAIDKIQVLSIKDNIRKKRVIKGLMDVDIPKRKMEYLIANELV